VLTRAGTNDIKREQTSANKLINFLMSLVFSGNNLFITSGKEVSNYGEKDEG